MVTIHLNGADAQLTANMLGGTIIMEDTTNDTVMLSGVEQTVIDSYGL